MIQESLVQKEQITDFSYFIKNFVNYDLWASIVLLRWLENKPEKLLEKEMTSSFYSIKQTLQHMWEIQGYWFSMMKKGALARGDTQLDNLEQIIAGMLRQSTEITDFIENLTQEQLNQKISIENPWFLCEYAVSEYIIQFVNHNTYYRGQIVAIGRGLGFTDAPNTEYDFYNVVGR